VFALWGDVDLWWQAQQSLDLLELITNCNHKYKQYTVKRNSITLLRYISYIVSLNNTFRL